MKRLLWACLSVVVLLGPAVALAAAPPAQNPQGGSIGVNGRIPSAAPKQAPTISTPSSGSSFNTIPIEVSGLCPSGYLIEVFKNDVFSGSVMCVSGSYNLQIDLFSGKNDLVARAYDALNQSSPDSNKVTVNFNDQIAQAGSRIAIVSAYATRGADPGSELSWPLSISGGTAPYAINVDWGDGSDQQLISEKFAGDFTINHTYKVAGTYRITIKATDASGDIAFLQLTGIGNGVVSAGASTSSSGKNGTAAAPPAGTLTKKDVIVPVVILAGATIASFWLGLMHQQAVIKAKLGRGDRIF